jgi:hypothetical protein
MMMITCWILWIPACVLSACGLAEAGEGTAVAGERGVAALQAESRPASAIDPRWCASRRPGVQRTASPIARMIRAADEALASGRISFLHG